MIAAAVFASRGRLNAMMPPNAEVGSVWKALLIGVENARRNGNATRVGMLDDDAGRARRTA